MNRLMTGHGVAGNGNATAYRVANGCCFWPLCAHSIVFQANTPLKHCVSGVRRPGITLYSTVSTGVNAINLSNLLNGKTMYVEFKPPSLARRHHQPRPCMKFRPQARKYCPKCNTHPCHPPSLGISPSLVQCCGEAGGGPINSRTDRHESQHPGIQAPPGHQPVRPSIASVDRQFSQKTLLTATPPSVSVGAVSPPRDHPFIKNRHRQPAPRDVALQSSLSLALSHGHGYRVCPWTLGCRYLPLPNRLAFHATAAAGICFVCPPAAKYTRSPFQR